LLESIIYPNTAHYTDDLVAGILHATRKTNPFSYPTLGSRPWNDPGPSRAETKRMQLDPSSVPADPRPSLKAIILDFSSVTSVDVTSVQNLVDVRRQLDRHASPDVVEWHFAGVRSPWARKALASVGFGRPSGKGKTVFSVAEVGGVIKEIDEEGSDDVGKLEKEDVEVQRVNRRSGNGKGSDDGYGGKGRTAAINSVDR
jgi:solute carrier family 26 (sodium-independent sulfate anion transporter), member 11